MNFTASMQRTESEHCADSPEVKAQPFVRQDADSMSDAEREAHIKSCGELMETAMRAWCTTGDFGYRGEADKWKLLMVEAIKNRSPAMVQRMERERGLA